MRHADGFAAARGGARAAQGELGWIWTPRPAAYLALTGGALAALLALQVVAVPLAYHGSSAAIQRGAELFLFSEEANAPTLFNFTLIGANAALLVLGAAVHAGTAAARTATRLGLAAIFVVLAFDEAAMLHERLNGVGASLVAAQGALTFAWVIFGAAFVAVVGLGSLGFLRGMPGRARALAIGAGALYCAGALGMEMVGGAYADRWGEETYVYEAIASVEETFEMVGMALFGAALLLEMRLRGATIAFRPGGV